MKYLFLVIGLIMVIVSVLQLSRFILQLGYLSNYGQGFMVGNLLLLVIGSLFIYKGYKGFKLE